MPNATTNYSDPSASDVSFNNLTVVYAGFWQRFAAFIIDIIILGAIGQILKMMLGAPSSEEIVAITQSEGFSSAVKASYFTSSNISSLIVNWLYVAALLSGPWQATLGKRALGIKVVGSNGQRISFLNATGRYFATLVSAIILFIGYFMMLWSDKKQALHDIMAGTFVVKGNANPS